MVLYWSSLQSAGSRLLDKERVSDAKCRAREFKTKPFESTVDGNVEHERTTAPPQAEGRAGS